MEARDRARVGRTTRSQVLRLRVGDFVEVRSGAEILATLDANGDLDGMPFMPEMLRFAGRRFRVYKRADKTCDTVYQTRGRRLPHTVHLETRCDGSGHDGCQAACLLFWKEAWLKRVDSLEQPIAPCGDSTDALYQLRRAASKPDPSDAASVVYRCQATQVPAATTLLKWWDARQYVRDVSSGNVGIGTALWILAKSWLNAIQRVRGGRQLPIMPEPKERKVRTPHVALNLQPGEWVQVRPIEEIVETLDAEGRNRGMRFDKEMVRWCGRTYRVHSRVEHIINERTGRMMRLKNNCIILEGVWCASECSRMRLLCPRQIYHYWREIWLRRVTAPETRGVGALNESPPEAQHPWA